MFTIGKEATIMNNDGPMPTSSRSLIAVSRIRLLTAFSKPHQYITRGFFRADNPTPHDVSTVLLCYWRYSDIILFRSLTWIDSRQGILFSVGLGNPLFFMTGRKQLLWSADARFKWVTHRPISYQTIDRIQPGTSIHHLPVFQC